MPQLTTDQLDTIVGLVESFCGTEAERGALIDSVFTGAESKPEIDTVGAPSAFTRRLVFRLRNYGEIEVGKPALWTLLDTLRPTLDVQQQTQIDTLKDAIFAAAIPAADFVIVAEGGKAIFISYSRQDGKLVERLRADLQAANFNLWIDRLGLKVGQRNWEREIRKALAGADCVLYVGSPHAADSNYVGAEIAIAEEKQKPIFSVWAAGEAWSESAPLSLVKAQYADLRGETYHTGFTALLESLAGGAVHTPEVEPAKPKPQPPAPPAFEPRNPYKGLRAFEAADRKRFFGRETFVETLLSRLREEPRFLAVIGASGSGKSSVLMAGLLPRLADGDAIPGSRDWRILNPFKPGKMPLESLTDQLGQYLPQLLPSDIRRELDHESARGLVRLAPRITNSRLVIYIDQFEELFTLTESDAERRQFIDVITTAVSESNSPVTILLTMRADFYDRPLAYGELGDLMSRHSASILPMTITELFDAVRKPAELPDVRLTFEDGLAEELVFAVTDEAGALPLLAFTLDLLFEQRDGLRLTWKAYRSLGGVHGALANYAEAVYDRLDDNGKRLARALFLRLIEPGATEQEMTRRRAFLRELAYTDPTQTKSMHQIVNTFVDARLLTTDSTGGEDTVEVSHEALIREWDRLQGWLHDAREDVTLMKRISADAGEWTRKGNPEDSLYRGRRLREAQEWARENPASVVETAFISASEAAEQAQIEAEQQRAEALRAAAERAELAAAEAHRSVDNAKRQRRLARIAIGIASAIILLAGIVGVFVAKEVSLIRERVAEANAQVTNANERLTPIAVTLDAADAQLSHATATLGYVQDQGTQVAAQATYFGIEQQRIGTLSAGAVVIPPGTLTPELLLPTLTGIAELREWEPRIITEEIDGVPIEMVEVPPGCFMMGSVAGDDEVPINEQCFSEPFYIDRYEVTQAQYTALGGESVEFAFPGDNRPVEFITWFKARDYCQDRRHARLPTEREWEYAARGPDSLIYPWGNTFVAANVVYNQVEAQGTGDVVDENGNPARPNGASWVGALDMSGNVYEWTSTRYDDLDFSERTLNVLGLFPYPYRADDGRETDETFEEFESRQPMYMMRVVRGGAWNYAGSDVRGAARNRYNEGNELKYIGLRCARSA